MRRTLESQDTGRTTSTLASSGQAEAGPKSRLAKPAFTTLQQHFSPKKSNKAPTSSFTGPSGDGSGASVSPEIARLQTELLQLSLMRDESIEVQKQWERSAKRHFQSKFSELVSMHEDLRAQEREVQEQINLRALHEWESGSQRFGLAESLQVLGSLLEELLGLSEPSGRYGQLVCGFEEWIGLVEEVWEARDTERGDGGFDADMGFADGLGEAWKVEATALARKLGALSREANTMNDPKAGSSVATVVHCCRQMVDGMSEELRLMQAIERDVVARERVWVDKGIAALQDEMDRSAMQADRETLSESWRTL